LVIPSPLLAQPGASPPKRALPPRIQVHTSSPCALPPVDVQSFLGLLDIELGDDGAVMATMEDDTLPYVDVDLGACEPGAREVKVAAGNPATKKSVRRTVAIADTPAAARPRLLALAVVELLRASWPELARSDSPKVEPAPTAPAVRPAETPAPPTEAPRPEASPSRVSLWLAFDGRWSVGIGQPTTAVDGARVGASIALPRRALRLIADAGAGYAHGSDPLGNIDLVVVSGALGLAGDLAIGSAHLELGVVIEPGAAWGSGRASSAKDHGSAVLDFVLVTSALATLRAPVKDRVSLLVTTIAGPVVRGVQLLANGHSAGGFSGGILGLRAGVGFDL
jgi:hypothetical protein